MGKTRPGPHKSGRSIAHYFTNPPKPTTVKTVSCPVCDAPVAMSNINKHLDSLCSDHVVREGDTKPNTTTQTDDEVTILDVNPVKGDERIVSQGAGRVPKPLSSIFTKRKLSSDKKDFDCKRVKAEGKVAEEDSLAGSFNRGDDAFLLHPNNRDSEVKTISTSVLEKEKDVHKFSSPRKTCSPSGGSPVKLSPSISYNPAKYGGLESLSQSGEKLIRSHSMTAAQKYSPVKRSLFSFEMKDLPSLPQHEPFTPRKRANPHYVPYYVTNFEYIIRCVIDCTDDRELFSEKELDIIHAYRTLPLSARKVYVRLFNRNHAWILETKINYDECPSVEEDAKLLVEAGLLEDKESMNSLEDALNILFAPDLKLVAKEFNIPGKVSGKAEIVSELVKLCQQRTVFQTSSSLQDKILKRAKSVCGECYRLEPTSRSVLNRVLCLWGVSQWWEQREDDRPPASLTTLLLTNQGRLSYPEYRIIRERRIFRSREDVVEFENCIKLVDGIESAVANKSWEEGYNLYQDIKVVYSRLVSDEKLMEHVMELQPFLRRLTSPAVIIFSLNRCVDLLEKTKRHSEAVSLLRLLLSQRFFPRYRGLWWERLTLDLENHLKDPHEALKSIDLALEDDFVRGGRRMSLFHRVLKICKAKKNRGLEERLSDYRSRVDWASPASDDLPTVVVSGKLVSKDGVSGAKSVFIMTDPEGGITYCNVEEYVREYYRRTRELCEGSHAEGAVLNSILGLLFWDIIYLLEIPDTFRDPVQAVPLDWDTDCFYTARKQQIDERIAEIAGMTSESVCDLLTTRWQENENIVSMVAWDRFRNSEHLAGLVRCITPEKLAKILHRMIKDHRTYRSGLPDLTLWNPETGEIWFVEVKGPGDKLSYKQIIWIRFFQSIGINTEVCHVESTGNLDSTGFRSYVKKSPKKTKKSPKKTNKSPNKAKSPTKSMQGDSEVSDFVDEKKSAKIRVRKSREKK